MLPRWTRRVPHAHTHLAQEPVSVGIVLNEDIVQCLLRLRGLRATLWIARASRERAAWPRQAWPQLPLPKRRELAQTDWLGQEVHPARRRGRCSEVVHCSPVCVRACRRVTEGKTLREILAPR